MHTHTHTPTPKVIDENIESSVYAVYPKKHSLSIFLVELPWPCRVNEINGIDAWRWCLWASIAWALQMTLL